MLERRDSKWQEPLSDSVIQKARAIVNQKNRAAGDIYLDLSAGKIEHDELGTKVVFPGFWIYFDDDDGGLAPLPKLPLCYKISRVTKRGEVFAQLAYYDFPIRRVKVWEISDLKKFNDHFGLEEEKIDDLGQLEKVLPMDSSAQNVEIAGVLDKLFLREEVEQIRAQLFRALDIKTANPKRARRV